MNPTTEVPALDVAKWLAGIRHVATCPGCPRCLAPGMEPGEVTDEPEPEEQTLNESVARN